MFNVSSYYEQSRELPAENGFQHAILKLADASIALREIGKIGSIFGLVGTATSAVFDEDPTFYLSIATISGLTWFCCHKIVQNIEPQARLMLEHFRDLQRERM